MGAARHRSGRHPRGVTSAVQRGVSPPLTPWLRGAAGNPQRDRAGPPGLAELQDAGKLMACRSARVPAGAPYVEASRIGPGRWVLDRGTTRRRPGDTRGGTQHHFPPNTLAGQHFHHPVARAISPRRTPLSPAAHREGRLRPGRTRSGVGTQIARLVVGLPGCRPRCTCELVPLLLRGSGRSGKAPV
jgi:hypothetical protein